MSPRISCVLCLYDPLPSRVVRKIGDNTVYIVEGFSVCIDHIGYVWHGPKAFQIQAALNEHAKQVRAQ